MTYRVNKVTNEYEIIEKDTDSVVFKTKKERKARNLCRSLNLGAGFDGFTPGFFTLKSKERPTK